jgi:AraC-like DNA-binding protein
MRSRPRVDALPENINYRDTGCDVSPSCLRCPLPRCKFDSAWEQWRERIDARNATLAELYARGLSVAEIAERSGLSVRSVYRAVGPHLSRRSRATT